MENLAFYIRIGTLGLTALFLVFLVSRSSQSKTAKTLSAVFASVIFWFSFEFFGSSFGVSENTSLLFWRLTFVAVYAMAFLLLRFIYILTKQPIWKILDRTLLIAVLLFSAISIFTNKIIKDIKPDSLSWGREYLTGNLFFLGALVIILPLIYSVYLIIKSLGQTQGQSRRKQLWWVLAGLAIPILIGTTTNLIFPILEISFPKLASLGVVGLIICFTYAIYRYEAMDIQVARLKINARLILILLAVTITSSAVGFIYFFQETRTLLKEEVYFQLDSISKAKVSNIEYFFAEKINHANSLSGSATLRQPLTTSKNENNYNEVYQATAERAEEIVAVRDEYLGLAVFNSRGRLELSTSGLTFENDENIIKSLQKEESFFSQPYFSESFQSPAINIYSPIRLESKMIGVLKLVISLEPIYAITTDYSGLRKTGETFIVSRDGLVLTPLKFQPEAALSLNIGNIHQACFENKNRPGLHEDYRGKKVEGVSSYMRSMDWCFLAEIDKEELDKHLTEGLVGRISVAFTLIIVLTIIVGRFSARTITRPLEKLRKDANIIEAGNYNHKAGSEDKDEIGDLSRAFDKMTSAIKKSRAEIDRKVKEQTEEIVQKQKLLSDQQKAVLNVLEDVEEEKNNVAKERDKIDAILHSIGDAVFAINNKLEITMFNEIAENISGYKEKEVLGKLYNKILKFVNEKDGKANDSYIEKVIKTGEPQEMPRNINLIKKTGEQVPVADSASPLRGQGGEVSGAVVVFRDVEKERAIDKAKTEFVSLASHQLRTPLTSINWYAEMVLSGDAGKLTPDQKSYLEEIYKGNQRMVSLVNSLLNVSRLELGTFVVEPKNIDIRKLADQEIKALLPQTKKKNITIIKKYDKKLTNYKADAKLLAMVFQNLLSNSVKYNNEGGEVSLEIKKREHDVQIIVKDNGFGIPKKQHKNIFTKLFRADNVRQMDTECTGLGLYIIKEIVTQAGGNIKFESEEGKGTTFYVSLPLEGMKKKAGTKTLD